MNRFGSALRNVFALVAWCAFVIALLFIFSTLQGQSGAGLLRPNSPSPCASTPDRSSKPSKLGVSDLPSPTVTPLPLSRTKDLAPDLSDQDKVYVYVMRCNGTFELFLIRPNTVVSDTIPLQAGDVILNWFPPTSLMGPPPRPGSGATFGSPLATPTRSSSPAFSSPLITPAPIGTLPLPPTPIPR